MQGFTIGLVLLCALQAPVQQREPVRAEAAPIQTVDEALARLPPIGREGTFDEAKGAWDLDPAVVWLTEYIASGGTLSDEQWRLALLRSKAILVRERWPVEMPFSVCMDIPAWLSEVTEIRATPIRHDLAAARAGSLSWISCGNCSDGNWRRAQYQELGKLDLGPQSLSLKVVIERGRQTSLYARPRGAPPPAGPPAGVLWTGSLDLQVEVVSAFEAALPGAHDEALDAAVRKALEPCIFEGTEIIKGTELILRAKLEGIPELANTAVSLEVELFEGTASHGIDTVMFLERPGFIDQNASLDLPTNLSDPSHWSIRVHGRATDALRAWNAERYWNGELVIPLADVPRR